MTEDKQTTILTFVLESDEEEAFLKLRKLHEEGKLSELLGVEVLSIELVKDGGNVST